MTRSHAELLRNTEDRTRYHNQLLNLDDEQKAALDRQIPISQNYADWLRKQPESKQLQVLGRKRLELWKSGKIGLSDLIDQTGRPLTIAELTA